MAEYRYGRFVWRELMTTDVEAARRFYGELFGWGTKSWDDAGEPYFMFLNKDQPVGGVMGVPKGAQIPPNWSSYVSVADVDAAAERAKQAGGQVMHGPMDIPKIGRFAAIVDPQGAAVCVYKGADSDPAPKGPPSAGEFCWESLQTTDPKAAVAFYEKVVGWKARDSMGMTTFGVGEKMEDQVADVMPAQGGVPPHWGTYVVVDNLESARDRAKRLGAKIVVEQIAIPNVGSFAVLTDPQGAFISLFQASMPG